LSRASGRQLPVRDSLSAKGKPKSDAALAAQGAVAGGGAFDAATALAIGGPLLIGDFGLLANCAAWALVGTAAAKIGATQSMRLRVQPTSAGSDLFWLRAQGFASVLMALATGLASCATLASKAPSSLALAAAIVAAASVALLPARDATRPGLVYVQAVCVIPLLCLGLWMRPDFYTPAPIVAALCTAFAAIAATRSQFHSKEESQGAERQLSAAMDSLTQSLAMFDMSSRLIAGNRHFQKMFGLSAETAADAVLDDLLKRKFATRLRDASDVGRIVEARDAMLRRRARDSLIVDLDEGRFVELTFQPMPDGFSMLAEDITRRRETEQRIERMARLDEVTGLANRFYYRERLQTATAGRDDASEPFAVLVVDLDRFKQVNDSLGHPVGDKLLKKVAERLQKIARAQDIVARIGGDEFVVLRFGDREDAALFAAQAVEDLCAAYVIDGDRMVVGASIGIAMMPEDGANADELMKAADMALYAAKNAGRGTSRFFERSMADKALRRQQIENDLRVGIGRNELEVHYQPIVSIARRRICACEALVRWRHPTRGMISPLEFIEIAEESGLVAPLGEWVLKQACIDAKSWPREVKLAVNFSVVQFRRGNIVEMVKRVLRETKFPPSRLEMEITESVLMNDSDSVLASIDELRDLGMQVALDDFGTGYSSLSYLSRFRPNKVKIDQSFVRDMDKNPASLAIIKAVKTIVVELGIDMLVEGVETVEQLETLRDAGADEAQGYLFSKPRPAREIAQFVADPAQLVRGRNLITPPCAPWVKKYERVSPSVVQQLH
jgi:diguanylate cyclase (GGDEF)-like protein/PAS domain S-box-containing protein